MNPPVLQIQLTPLAVGVLFLIVAVVTIWQTVRIVDAYEKVALTVFGEYRKLLEPGLNLIPPFVSRTYPFDMRTQTLDMPRQEAITRDNSPVIADAVVYIKVMDAEKAFLEVDNHKRTVSNLAQTTLQAVLSDMELDDALNKRQEISTKIRKEIEEPIDEWGIRVERVEVRDVNLSKENQQAMEQSEEGSQREQQTEAGEALRPPERSLQEAIVAYIENDQTVARIRFRQARDTFEDAHKTIVENEADLLTEPAVVDVQPDREPSSTTLSDLPGIPETAAAELTDVGIETIEDLDGSDEPPWMPVTVEEMISDNTIDEDVATTLTLLSWCHGDESYEFATTEAVERRQQQADYGFNQSS